jgi:hypothetical protein
MNCRFCGTPDSPVRQVPVPIPYSDCYCDACAEVAEQFFLDMFRRIEPHRAAEYEMLGTPGVLGVPGY